jgi:glycosyltransferase involved in cell wall biosynthesis
MEVETMWRHPVGFSEPNPISVPMGLLREIARSRPDVIVSAELGLRSVWAAAYRTFHRDTRLILWARLSMHSEKGRGYLRHVMRQALLRGADAAVTNGASGREYLMRLSPRTSVFVARQSSGVVPAVPHNVPQRPRRLLFVGRLIQLKGLAEFFRALSDVPPRAAEVTVAGDGPERPRLEKLAHQHQLPVHFLGWVERPRLGDLYGKHDFFVFPSLSDEWALAVVEALQAGLPVMGSVYAQAVTELVREGANGWLFRPDHPADLRAALARALATGDEDLQRMSWAATQTARGITPAAMADVFFQAAQA